MHRPALQTLYVIGIGLFGFMAAHATDAPATSQSTAPPSAASSASPVVTVNLNDKEGILRATLMGDQDKLAYVASTESGGVEILATALRQRSLFQLADSSGTVADCGGKSKIANSFGNAECALILAGNKLLVNDIAGWAGIMEDDKTIAYPKLAQKLGEASHRDPSTFRVPLFEVVPDYRPFLGVPPVAVARKAKAFDLTLEQQPMSEDGHANAYAVKVFINGQPIRLVFDTGTPVVLLSADDAKKLGVDPIYPNWLPVPEVGNASLGVIKQLKLGEIEISNMPVAISTKPLKYPVLGLSAIQYLGAFRIHGDTLHSASEGFADCTLPMDMASDIDGLGLATLARGTVEEHPFPFAVVTGMPGSIVRSSFGSPSASVSAKPITNLSPFGTEYSWYSTDHAVMEIGGSPSSDQEYQVMYHASHTRFRYYLGADYIRQHDLTMDFNRGVMCLK